MGAPILDYAVDKEEAPADDLGKSMPFANLRDWSDDSDHKGLAGLTSDRDDPAVDAAAPRQPGAGTGTTDKIHQPLLSVSTSPAPASDQQELVPREPKLAETASGSPEAGSVAQGTTAGTEEGRLVEEARASRAREEEQCAIEAAASEAAAKEREENARSIEAVSDKETAAEVPALRESLKNSVPVDQLVAKLSAHDAELTQREKIHWEENKAHLQHISEVVESEKKMMADYQWQSCNLPTMERQLVGEVHQLDGMLAGKSYRLYPSEPWSCRLTPPVAGSVLRLPTGGSRPLALTPYSLWSSVFSCSGVPRLPVLGGGAVQRLREQRLAEGVLLSRAQNG
ncbi:hypothetical protein ACQ4PT_041159 [Festuca glaucescens]